MAEVGIAGGALAVQAVEFLRLNSLFGNRSMPPMARPDYVAGAAEVPSLENWNTWNAQDDGYYSFTYGSICITRPLHGIGLTVNPHNPAHFYIRSLGDGYVSISLDNKYLFAGDQATVKTGKDHVKEWERFVIRKVNKVVNGQTITLCTIQCKRDSEYWHIDEEGMIRHRNRKEKGFICQVFAMQKR